MTTVDALLTARQELQDAFDKDMQAINHLLTRLGYRESSEDAPKPLVLTPRPQRTADAPTAPGSLRDWVERAFVAHSSEQSLSAPIIYDWARRNGATFQADRDKSIQSLGNVLRTLTAEGKLKVKTQGSGRRPSFYEQVGVSQDQQEEAAM